MSDRSNIPSWDSIRIDRSYTFPCPEWSRFARTDPKGNLQFPFRRFKRVISAWLRQPDPSNPCVNTYTLVGFLVVSRSRFRRKYSSLLEIDQLEVHPSYWRQGIGSKLLSVVQELYPNYALMLELGSKKSGVSAFYYKQGFQVYYFDPSDLSLYLIRLSGNQKKDSLVPILESIRPLLPSYINTDISGAVWDVAAQRYHK